MSTTLHVLRVFTDEAGRYGNALGVFVDGRAIAEADRQEVARELAFSETVFVDDARTGRIRIYTPADELRFAGHPTVGTAWLLAELGLPVDELQVPAGPVPTWSDGVRRWVRARPEWVHPMTLLELDDPDAVEALATAPPDERSWYPWAWQDRALGEIRSRYFAPLVGIAEDEATGAAAVVITAHLGRDLEIQQGRGSRLSTRLRPDGSVDLGGRVVLDATRPYG
jgi:predicted PhzF superfamily epimerase YddE/YHI9